MHIALPVVDLYFPAAQAAHVPPSGPVYPALHVQAVTAELCPRALVLTGHCKHVVAAVTPTYFPSRQLVHAVAPATENCPAAHEVHVGVPVTFVDVPAPAENFPATHETHAEAPVSFVYSPGTQSLQVVAAATEVFPVTHEIHSGSTETLLYLPATQPVQAVAPPSENFPISHDAQAASPAVALYVFMPQDTQQIPVVHESLSQQPQHFPQAPSYSHHWLLLDGTPL